MNWGILAFVIIYEVLTVLVVGAIIARKNKQASEEGNFAFAHHAGKRAYLGNLRKRGFHGSHCGMVRNRMYGYDDRYHTDHRSLGQKNRDRDNTGSVRQTVRI